MPKYFKNHEIETAKALGGKRNPFSGSLDGEADAQSSEFLVECKTAPLNNPRQYRFQFSDWWQTHKQATLSGLIPLMAIEFEGVDLFILAWNDLKNLSRIWKKTTHRIKIKSGAKSFLMRLDSTAKEYGWLEFSNEVKSGSHGYQPFFPVWLLDLDEVEAYVDDYHLAVIAKEDLLTMRGKR